MDGKEAGRKRAKMKSFITVNEINFPINTQDEVAAAKKAMRQAGMKSAAVWSESGKTNLVMGWR